MDVMTRLRPLWQFVRTSPKVRHTAIYTLASGAAKAIPFVFLPYITAQLTPTGYGVWAMYMALFLFFVPFLGGMFTQYIAKTYNTATPEHQSHILSNTFGLSALLCLGMLGVGLVWWMVFGASFVAFSLCTLPFFCWLNITRETFHYLLKARFASLGFAAAEIGYTVLFYGTVLALLAGNAHTNAIAPWQYMVTGTVAAHMALVAVLWWHFTRRYTLRLVVHVPTAKTLLLFSLPLLPHALSAAIMGLSDRVLVEHFLSLETLGVYAIGVQIAMVLQVFMASLQNVWQPWALAHAASPTFQKHQPFRGLRKHLLLYFVSLVAVAAGVAVAGYVYILKAFTEPFHAAVPVVFVVLISLLFRSVYTVCYPFLLAGNKLPTLQKDIVLCTLLNIGVAIALLPTLGMVGAAWGTVVGYAYLSLRAWRVVRG